MNAIQPSASNGPRYDLATLFFHWASAVLVGIEGASLRRAQVLRYDNDLIAQRVYLDDRQQPLALCFLKSPQPDDRVAGPSAAACAVLITRLCHE
ncbi:hypothetical protein ALQ95_00061 [Pseudomonas syringae pv. ribicola]|uniref:Uncharacterized protein n=1 Tax=Pseudomonas syringae pv. ribicola TaxID=55398 RepID=A0A3M2VL13_PSESI|nr:hypothetical protein ALQ95_00061 [Pseudomonas syringae pv. ribicola]